LGVPGEGEDKAVSGVFEGSQKRDQTSELGFEKTGFRGYLGGFDFGHHYGHLLIIAAFMKAVLG
jgi:hypothetical protein